MFWNLLNIILEFHQNLLMNINMHIISVIKRILCVLYFLHYKLLKSKICIDTY